jgi:hypothetical protein
MVSTRQIATRQRSWRALSGVLFAAFFLAGDPLSNAFASTALPLPGAPAAAVARYYATNRAAVLVSGFSQLLAALALLIFAGCVVYALRRVWSAGSARAGLTRAGGALAGAFLLVSALLALALVPVAAGGNLALVAAVRELTFLSGGTLHVAALGLFMGAASLAARRSRALPGWLCGLGLVAAALALLSLASLVVYPATILILLGRLLGFVWSIAVGLVLTLGLQRARAVEAAEGGDQLVHA